MFHAVKKRISGEDIHEIAIREYGIEKYAKILRFFFVLPDLLVKLMDKWIAVPRPNVYNK